MVKQSAAKNSSSYTTGAVVPGHACAHEPAMAASQRGASNQAMQRLLRSGTIQAKLTVNQPGDRYEREADRVANDVMRMPDPVKARAAGVQKQTQARAIQRMCTECEEEQVQRQQLEDEEEETIQSKAEPGQVPEITPEVQKNLSAIRGGGQPLSESSRAFFEPRFGSDFSNVRVHTGVTATQSVRAIRARAFTSGRDIVFAPGEYAPGTPKGNHLLAHELTHTIQQEGSQNMGNQQARLQRAAGDEELPFETLNSEPTLATDTGEPVIQDSPGISFRVTPPEGAPRGREEETTIQRAASGEGGGANAPEQEAASETPYHTGLTSDALTSALRQGQPLDDDVRTSMESRYGRSLDHLRVHTDSKAASLSNRFSAKAFTFGNHIAFAQGAYAPRAAEGDRLLRHEVTHVLESKPNPQSVYRAGLCPTTCPPAGAPPFVPVSDSTFNCYSYALDSPGSGFLAPGQRAGTAEFSAMAAVLTNALATPAEKTAILPYFTVAGVKRNTDADIGSAISSNCTLCCSAPNRKIIEVATDSATSFTMLTNSSGGFRMWAPMVSNSERWDFHWYRKDADRAWSHKHGGLDAQRNDESGTTPICNPCNADRNFGPNYRNVVGSWCV